jgi:hypothetical protein
MIDPLHVIALALVVVAGGVWCAVLMLAVIAIDAARRRKTEVR